MNSPKKFFQTNLNKIREPSINEDENVYFDDIENQLIKHIKKSKYIIGCVAWLTNKNIIKALKEKDGIKIIVNKEEYLNSTIINKQNYFYKSLRYDYSKLPDLFESICSCCSKKIQECDNFNNKFNVNYDQKGAILTCGIVNNYSKMHHKFLIFMDEKYNLEGVWTGSYNFSANSNLSLENAVFLTDEKIINAYKKEFETIYNYSESSDWKSGILYFKV